MKLFSHTVCEAWSTDFRKIFYKLRYIQYAFFCVICTSAFALPSEVTTYEQLIQAIRQTRQESKLRTQKIVEQERVREAWEIGHLIDEHVLQHKERANYGEKVLERLSRDLGISVTELRYMLQFTRVYSNNPPGDGLSWSHYRALLAINDEKEREEVTRKAAAEHWNRDQVRKEVRRRKAAKNTGVEPDNFLDRLPAAAPGKLNTYKVILAQFGQNKGKLVLDLGFSNYCLPDKGLRYEKGDILEWAKKNWQKLKKGTSDDLYTYKADVIHVIDGDTFTAAIELGCGITTVQKLRLRGIDAPEIATKDGQEAREFLAERLKKSPVIIRTVKSDKYDRYLADVFVLLSVPAGQTGPNNIIGNPPTYEYLNQKLIEEGLAVKVRD